MDVELEHFDKWGSNPEPFFAEKLESSDSLEFSFIDIFTDDSLAFLPNDDGGSFTDENTKSTEDDVFDRKNRDRWTIQSRLYVDSALPEEYQARLNCLRMR